MVSKANLIDLLDTLDWVVFTLVLGLTLASVVYGQVLRNRLRTDGKESTLELLLMGRKLTLPFFVATLVATWYGGIFGVTALTFERGIYNFLTQGIFWYGTYIIFALYLVKRIRSRPILTIPDLSQELFGPRARKVTAGLNFLNLLPVAYTLSLGIFLQSLFGGGLFLNTVGGVALVTLWSLWGGFRAVVFSDIVQFFFMILAVLLVVVFAWGEFGSPMELMKALPATHLDITGGESWGNLLVWGFIAASTLVDPNFYQRALAADSTRTARRGIFVSTIIWVIFDCCTTLGALYARAHLPEASPQDAYLQFAIQVTPHGVRGLIIAGILAIILSTLDSYLFNAATSISYDLFNLKNRFRAIHHHVALVFVAAVSILLGLHFEGNVVEVWKTLGSFSAACLLFPLLIGQWFPGRISDRAFTLATLSGCVGIVLWRFLNKKYSFSSLDEFYIGLLLTTIILIPSLLREKRTA